MEVDRNGLEVLGRAECLALLGTVPLGRLALSVSALPVVLPVGFTVDGDRLLVRTTRGSKLDAALAGAVVAFEADHYDEVTGDAWSVLVRGASSVLAHGPGDADRLLAASAWVPATADRWVAIPMDLVTGRRFRVVGPGRLSAPAAHAT